MFRRWGRGLRTAACAGVVVFGFTCPAAAQATATVAGTVRDAQGAAVAGATVTLVSESRGTAFATQSTTTGDFVVPNIPGDTYTVKVETDGFKTSERRGVAVSPGERVAVGTVTMEAGARTETVIVSAEAPLVQAQTGERSFVVASQSVDNLPITGRNYASLAQLTPGTVTTTNTSTGAQTVARADGAQTAYLLDGVSNVDPGNNQQVIQLSPDAIAQVRVVSTAYQAEYGRAAGIQILGATKSGTNQFRGSLYDLERRTAWNANTWANQRNGNAKPVADQRDWGFTVGGPVGKPGGRNELFFFFSEQLSPRTDRRRHQSLPRADGAGTAGGLLAEHGQHRCSLQRDQGLDDGTALHGGRHPRLLPGWRRARQDSARPALSAGLERAQALASAQHGRSGLQPGDRLTRRRLHHVPARHPGRLPDFIEAAAQREVRRLERNGLCEPRHHAGLQRRGHAVPGHPDPLGDGDLRPELQHGGRRHLGHGAEQREGRSRRDDDLPTPTSSARGSATFRRCIRRPSCRRGRIRRRC